MKIKESNNKIAHVAWSPAQIYPAYIVSGTAAEQLDSSFSTKSTLDILKLDLTNFNTDLEVAGTINTDSRFCKLLWSEYSSSAAKDIIIGGCENGQIYLYDYEKILNGKPAVLDVLNKHVSSSGSTTATNNVGALDINPFQTNLLASGAGQSEILIWDLNQPHTPMTPGAKLQPLDDINCLAWNHQVQHILASTSSGKCVVWDLRKNESIIKVSDSMSKMKAKLVTWHPDVATQMCMSSDDDHTPFLQIWDLRFATSPVRVLEGHQRGILAFSWSRSDSNLLLSSAKDSRILCWNPNNPTVNGEILYELPTNSQWCFDLSLSRRNPDLICTSSFEGQINVYSMMGGKYNVNHQTSSKIMDSFGVIDANSMPAKPAASETTHVVEPLKIAPKWMKRPCRASFAFGGKLVTFGRYPDATPAPAENGKPSQNVNNQQVIISQVITDPALVQNSYYLENVLQTNNFVEYCNYKIESAKNQPQSYIWNFIQATFTQQQNEKFISLLGFNSEDLDKKTSEYLSTDHDDQLAKQVDGKLNLRNGGGGYDNVKSSRNSSVSVFDHHHDQSSQSGKPRLKSINDDNVNDTFNDIARSMSPVNLNFDSDVDNLVSELLMLGKYEQVVDILIQENRFTDAILIANFFDKNLYVKAQQSYFRHFTKNKFANLLEKFLNRDWSSIVKTCNLDSWKEALATVLTYTQSSEQFNLSNELGSRLEYDNRLLDACVCYICSPDLDKFVQCWEKLTAQLDFTAESESLQDLVEKVMIFRYSLSIRKKLDSGDNAMTKFYSKIIDYAKLLADQGCFLNAYTYLNDLNDHSIAIMKDRLFNAIDPQVAQQYRLRKPESPFKVTQQLYSQVKPSLSSTSSREPAQQQRRPLGSGYHHMADPSISKTPLTASLSASSSNNYYNPPINNSMGGMNSHSNQYIDHSKPANVLNTPFLPVSSANHPMPTANLYSASANNNMYRSVTPVVTPAPPPPPPSSIPVQQPPTLPQPTLTNQQPTTFFSPSIQNNSTPNNGLLPNVNQSPPSYMHAKPPTAWNDPPIVTPKIRQPSLKEPVLDQMPTFFQPPPAPMPGQQYNYYQQPGMDQSYQQQQMGYNPIDLNRQQQQPPTPSFHSQQQQNNMAPAATQQAPPQPPAPVEKGPIPAEHQILKSVFDTLLNNCLNANNQPTLKRKLDDVTKKLEVLYDKLRESSLSAGVLQGLHAMVEYIKINDYQSALAYHTNLVGTSNFSEISGFMPGIKVLIQSCQQFNVHF